ncbi:MAG TPA: NUDIX domain-containing protein [Candidatus Paceibacterota bacterium]|nr:NUDIX domain-containing protein [Candidatus Paceibacterota bacterium]
MENESLKNFVSIFKGMIFQILQKKNDGKTFEIARRSPGVRMLVITPDKKLILTRERRLECNNQPDYRLPGGKVADTLDEYLDSYDRGVLAERILSALQKELREETGIIVESVNDIELIHTSLCGGTVHWYLYYFLIKNFSRQSPEPEQGEEIEVLELPIKEVVELLLLGRMSEDRSRAVLYTYLLKNYPKEFIAAIKN